MRLMARRPRIVVCWDSRRDESVAGHVAAPPKDPEMAYDRATRSIISAVVPRRVGLAGGADAIPAKTEDMKAQDDIDRQLEQLGRSSAVDEDLARLKAEPAQGTSPAPQLDPGGAAEETQR